MQISESDKWLSYRREITDAQLRLFCFPFGGGGASVFAPWGQMVPDGVEVCPVQPPGRENRLSETPVTRMPQMIALIADALTPYLDCPFALFGHSVGAMIIFELARELRRRELRTPEWLFASGHPSPDLPRRRPFVSHLALAEFIRAMHSDFEVDSKLFENDALREIILPVLRADYELVESYTYNDEPPLEIPLSIFGGSRDPETTRDELAAWQRHTTGLFRIRMFEGNHMFIRTSSEALLREVARDLERVLHTARRSGLAS